MKYYSGQTVTLLNTEYKPAGRAVICKYEETSDKYEVQYQYPDRESSDNILVPEDRLVQLNEFMQD